MGYAGAADLEQLRTSARFMPLHVERAQDVPLANDFGVARHTRRVLFLAEDVLRNLADHDLREIHGLCDMGGLWPRNMADRGCA